MDTDKKLYRPIASNNRPRIGKCSICKEENIPLVLYHIFKRIVFGSYKSDSVGYVCKECKHRIHHTIRVMENEILQNFAPTYEMIWSEFIQNKHFPTKTLKALVKDQFEQIRTESFSNQINLEIDECYEEERGIIGTCLCCNKEGVALTKHHPLRKKVFGSSNEFVFLCRDCHDLIEKVVTRFEKIVLRKFSRCNGKIWKIYVNKGSINDSEAKELARQSLVEAMNRMSSEILLEESTNEIAVKAN